MGGRWAEGPPGGPRVPAPPPRIPTPERQTFVSQADFAGSCPFTARKKADWSLSVIGPRAPAPIV